MIENNSNQATISNPKVDSNYQNNQTFADYAEIEGSSINPKKNLSQVKKTNNGNFVLVFFTFVLVFITGIVSGGLGAVLVLSSPNLVDRLGLNKLNDSQKIVQEISNIKTVNEQSAIIEVAENTTDSVVSIVITRNLPSIGSLRDFFNNRMDIQTRRREVGAGSGFIVTADGFIITNKHVVEDARSDYTVVFNDGSTLPARVLATDPLMDIAVIKVDAGANKTLKPIQLGDSSNLKIGQTAIAIGNSLGEFNNTFSKGIISGLGRTIVASDQAGDNVEVLDNVIQTDASINQGNSGGPLVDINGNVIGVNVANSPNAQNVGFSIPINDVKPALQSVIETGTIQRPYLGISFLAITPEFAKLNNLPVNYGALLNANNGGSAVTPNGPAAKVGLRQGDVILEIDGTKIDEQNPLQRLVQTKKVGQEVKLKIKRGDADLDVNLILEARPSS